MSEASEVRAPRLAALTRHLDELGPERTTQLQAISTDMSITCLKATREHDVEATVRIDPVPRPPS